MFLSSWALVSGVSILNTGQRKWRRQRTPGLLAVTPVALLCTRRRQLPMLCQRARNSIILALGGTLNIFEQIQTPPNVPLLLRHTCMLSVPTLSSSRPRSVHLSGLTPALRLLRKIGWSMSSLTVPGHTSFPSSLDHQVFSLHPSLWHLTIVVCFGPLPILAPPSLLSCCPLFFWVSCAHASGDLELSLLVLPSEGRCCDHT